MRGDEAPVGASRSDDESLRRRIRELVTQLDGMEERAGERERALKEAVSLLVTVARPALEGSAAPLVAKLGRIVKERFDVTAIDGLLAEVKGELTREETARERTARGEPAARPSAGQIDEPGRAGTPEPLSSRASQATSSGEREAEATPAPRPSRETTEPGSSTGGKPEAERRSTPDRASSSDRASAADLALEERVRDLLRSLLDRLGAAPEAGLAERIGRIARLTAEPALRERLPGIQSELVATLDQYRRLHDDARAEAEQVLKDTLAQLAEIEASMLHGMRDDYAELLADNSTFIARIEEQARELQDSAALGDLTSIERMISARVKTMRASIQTKRQFDARLSAAHEEKVELLEGQLAEANRRISLVASRAARDALLDGVYNRMAFDERLREEAVQLERHGHGFSLILFDIDRFKQVNDRHGHQAGDEILKSIATIARESISRGDFLARYGGDEFAVILPHTRLADAIAVAERLRCLVADSRPCPAEASLKVTLSLGVATARPGEPVESLVQRADQSLYLAKARNRDQVRSEADLPPETNEPAASTRRGVASREAERGHPRRGATERARDRRSAAASWLGRGRGKVRAAAGTAQPEKASPQRYLITLALLVAGVAVGVAVNSRRPAPAVDTGSATLASGGFPAAEAPAALVRERSQECNVPEILARARRPIAR